MSCQALCEQWLGNSVQLSLDAGAPPPPPKKNQEKRAGALLNRKGALGRKTGGSKQTTVIISHKPSTGMPPGHLTDGKQTKAGTLQI